MMDAIVYQKTPLDKVVILSQRGYLNQPFRAPNWLDLRVGWFLSLTQTSADDVTTGLAETVPASRYPADRYWIGLRNRGTAMPDSSGETQGMPHGAKSSVTFVGFSNRYPASADLGGDSVLSSSDQGIGHNNAFFWRPNSSANPNYSFLILDGQTLRGQGGASGAALAQHFPQDPVGAGGYAVLLAIRLTRPSVTSRTITAHIKRGTAADMLYSNAPTKELIREVITAWPDSALIGPAQLAVVPNAIYCYWPFRNSRLRIHSVGVLKFA